MKKLLLSPCLAVFLLPAAAFDNSDVSGLDVTFDVLSFASQHFSMGLVGDRWSEGIRYEINGLTQLDSGRVQPSGGIYAFYEDRNWSGRDKESAKYSAWGIGLQGGATINLIPPERRTKFMLVPYFRGGIGFQDLTVYNVKVTSDPNDRVNLSAGSGRIEVSVNVDLRLVLARRFEFVFGGGAAYWSAADVYITAGSGGGGVGAVGNSYAFSGTDAYVRMGAGVHF